MPSRTARVGTQRRPNRSADQIDRKKEEAPTLDAALYNLTRGCAEVEQSLSDDLRASMALSEAGL